jgi:hypothetical protein
VSSRDERERWEQRAAWLAQLGLAEGEPAPVEHVEDVANATLALLAEVGRLEREVAHARAWAWSEFHRHYDERWLPTVEVPELESGQDWDVPRWLTDSTEPHRSDWWPR